METKSQRKEKKVGRVEMRRKSITILVRSFRVKKRSIDGQTGSRKIVLFFPIG